MRRDVTDDELRSAVLAGQVWAINEKRERMGLPPYPSTRDRWLADLDPDIREFVDILDANGVETYESCQGGPGHSYPEPGVRFHGSNVAGFHAYAVAIEHGLPVWDLRRFWSVEHGELVGPSWQLTFIPGVGRA